MNSVIAERTKGQFPISIATSLAYESLMNIHEFTKHNRIPVFDYRVMWVNVATLLRNIIGSCSDRDRALSDVEGLVEAIIEEMEFIRSFSYNEAKDNVIDLVMKRLESRMDDTKVLAIAKDILEKER